MIFESHAHYDDEAFDEDREQLLSSMQEHGIEYIVNVGASLKSTETTVALTWQYPFIYGAAGVRSDWIITGRNRIMRYRRNGSSDSWNWQEAVINLLLFIPEMQPKTPMTL